MGYRNIFHMVGSIVPLLYLYSGKKYALFFASLVLLAISIVELLRIKGYLNLNILRYLIKESEAKRPTGSFFFILSSVFVIVLFEEKTAILSLFVLSFSDPFAAFVGAKVGKKRLFGKSIEGSFAFFLIAFVIVYLGGENLLKALIVALISTLAEFFSFRIDDNLTVPLATALTIHFLNF